MKFKIIEKKIKDSNVMKPKINLEVNNCDFIISDTKSLLGDKEKAIKIELLNKEDIIGNILIEELKNKELNNKYVQLRFVGLEDKYRGGNGVILLYEKAIEYAESLGKELLFDSHLTPAAYKSFRKLENYGYKVIENPETKIENGDYVNRGSWVLRVERNNKKDNNL